ncbi:MAG: hypothetical protein II072_05730, partial [Clostridia bacterium]|nr:hypothetical protein [Clostridia bacterium]
MVMGRKAKQMEQQIQQLLKDIEAMKAAASEKELELKICKDELASTKTALDGARGELTAANKSLEDFRSRQAAIVSAMEEATNTKERILNEARASAAKQEAEGKARREQLISEGQSMRDRARNEANATTRKANEEAENKVKEAAAAAEKTVGDAEKLANEMIADAKSKAKDIVQEAEDSVIRLTAKSDELSIFLREKARIALEETKLYTEILDSVADCKELSDLPHECDFDCANCENKCDDY